MSCGGRLKMGPTLCLPLLLLCLVVASSAQDGPPVLREHPSSVVVRRNEPVTLNCASSGAARIRWFRDGEEVTTSPQDPRAHRVLLPAGSLFFLRVTATRRESDAGTYWCVASNRYGATRSRNATLTVATLSSEFQSVPEPAVKARVGDSVSLPCRPPRGTPQPEVTWLRDGRQVSDSSRVHVTEDGDLAISNAVEKDSAVYVCRARNAAGSREAPATTLSVMTPPWFEEQPANVTAASGVVVELACRARGSPSPKVTWRRLDGKMPLGRATLEETRLVLQEVAAADSGVYVCEAESEAGRAAARATLTVVDAPELTQRPQHLQVMAGEDASVSCRVEGEPRPMVVWRLPTLDRTALLAPGQSNGRASVSEDGHTLLLRQAATEDSGTYYCWGVSTGGGVSAWAEVVVVLALPPPVVGVGPQDQEVAPGGVATFRCEVVSEAAEAQVTWHYRPAAHLPARPLSQGDAAPDPRLSLPDNGALIIKDVRPEDAGIYSCHVEASTGSVEQSAALRVSEEAGDAEPLPLLPAPPTKPRAVDVNGTAVRLSWLPNSQEGGEWAQWYSVEYWRRGWPEWRVADAVTTQESCVVDQLAPGNTYTFLVRAVSNRGASFPSPWSDPVTARSRRESGLDADQVRQARRRLGRPVLTLSGAAATAPDSVLLTWEFLAPSEGAVEGVLVYSVAESGGGDVQVATVLGAAASSSSHAVNGLQPFTPYTFFVVPFWRSVEGTPSNSYSLTTPEDVPLEAPGDVRVAHRDEGSVLIQWSAVEGAAVRGRLLGYRVTLSHNGSHSTQTVASPWLEATGLHSGRLYTVRVSAITGAGAGPSSDPVLIDARSLEEAQTAGDGVGGSVLYAPPQPSWLAYLLIPLVVVLFLATAFYVRRLRHKAPPSNPPHAPSLYQDPSLCPDHHSVNMYSEHKLWRPSESDKDSSLSSTRLLRPDQLNNEYAEPRVQRPNEATEPYATTALLAPPSPHLQQGTPWRHHSDDSGVQVNWAAILPPPPACPPPLDLGDLSVCCHPYRAPRHYATTQCGLIGEPHYEHPDARRPYARITPLDRPTDMVTFSSLDSRSSIRSSSCSSHVSHPTPLPQTDTS
ncbi:roundabout homolog 2-like [Eriocheir sinensis]|uniref:roundabout homolog 2-like n=1 Tax=Eriocheir sinensis TaxID=95602 RepID=UPI0021C872CA|nr:roundabout homolog 2-like [Eriocheir sinensis]